MDDEIPEHLVVFCAGALLSWGSLLHKTTLLTDIMEHAELPVFDATALHERALRWLNERTVFKVEVAERWRKFGLEALSLKIDDAGAAGPLLEDWARIPFAAGAHHGRGDHDLVAKLVSRATGMKVIAVKAPEFQNALLDWIVSNSNVNDPVSVASRNEKYSTKLLKVLLPAARAIFLSKMERTRDESERAELLKIVEKVDGLRGVQDKN